MYAICAAWAAAAAAAAAALERALVRVAAVRTRSQEDSVHPAAAEVLEDGGVQLRLAACEDRRFGDNVMFKAAFPPAAADRLLL